MIALFAALALSTTPMPTPQLQTGELICKRIDKTKPIAISPRVCATKAQWKAYREIVQKNERLVLTQSQSYAGVGSGY
ncbi:MAG: hypothetical protein ACRCY3_02330 [Sphingorhabdus sp.]